MIKKIKCFFGFHKFKKTPWFHLFYCNCGQMRCFREKAVTVEMEKIYRQEFR